MQDPPISATTSVAIGQRAFTNYNGVGISVCYSPRPPSAAQQAAYGRAQHSNAVQQPQQPPQMVAVVLDASMAEHLVQSALQALTEALSQLNPQTRLLLLVASQVVSVIDLKTSRPHSWVVHGANSQSPALLPQAVRAADVRATPLSHCQPYLANSLTAIRHHPHRQSMLQHSQIAAAAVDIALFLLTASMAAWDAQHRRQQQQQLLQRQQQPSAAVSSGQAGQQQQQQPMQQPVHNARVFYITGLPNNSTASATTVAQVLRQLDPQQAQQLQQMYKALAAKAASLDVPIDVITGSISAPAALLLQEVVTASHGRSIWQPQLQPPLASNIVAVIQSRFGWEGVLDVRVPAGVKVVQVSGPLAPDQPLPQAARLSGKDLQVLLLGSSGWRERAGTPRGTGDGSAASTGNTRGSLQVDVESAARSADQAAYSSQQQASQQQSTKLPSKQEATAAASVGSGPVAWSSSATVVPVLSTGSRIVAELEFSKDWQAGSSFNVQIVCEWTAVDGQRVRQICSHTVHITDRLSPFLDGLDVSMVVLLMAQRLMFAALAAAAPSANLPLAAAAPPKPQALEERRLAVGMALIHVAQRLGHAHTSRRGILGFGSQQVWQLPDDLIPLALSLYQLQRGPLLHPAAVEPEPVYLPGNSTDNGSLDIIHSAVQAERSTSTSSATAAMYGSWQLMVQQFMQAGPSAALRMVAPWLYVYNRTTGQFDVLPPVNLALKPDSLAVLDYGVEVIIYVGEVLQALMDSAVFFGGKDQQAPPGRQQRGEQQQSPGTQHLRNGEQPQGQQSQQELQDTKVAQQSGSITLAAAAKQQGNAATPLAATAVEVAASSSSNCTDAAVRQDVPDMAVVAAPAVQCAHQLIRGRVPVPAVKLIEGYQEMVRLMKHLVPLHKDPVALQLLLLPRLSDLTPAQHGYLLDWHKHWYETTVGINHASIMGGNKGCEGRQEQSFGEWYSSFGVVLRSPGGTLASDGGAALE